MDKIAYLLFLSICGWQDWRQRQISRWLLAVFMASGAVAAFLRSGITVLWLADMLPGLFLLGIGILTRGSIGAGDAWAVASTGLFFGWISAVAELFLGLLLAAVWGGIGILRRQKNRHSRMAFLPFLWTAAVLLLLLG